MKTHLPKHVLVDRDKAGEWRLSHWSGAGWTIMQTNGQEASVIRAASGMARLNDVTVTDQTLDLATLTIEDVDEVPVGHGVLIMVPEGDPSRDTWVAIRFGARGAMVVSDRFQKGAIGDRLAVGADVGGSARTRESYRHTDRQMIRHGLTARQILGTSEYFGKRLPIVISYDAPPPISAADRRVMGISGPTRSQTEPHPLGLGGAT